ncbi:hypothetical protein [Herbaspirillum robiniae]|uniref:Uncharacterized protein n=1 Tax=Herbaspirillum robiniae TaxID=2014887 RepID=A0ABX2M2P3_9BURK|nr:hypothetical protein [Herbaspirillum robiniae]NUU02521.1 hypothetical protein [Herbaspirillum robiniae]
MYMHLPTRAPSGSAPRRGPKVVKNTNTAPQEPRKTVFQPDKIPKGSPEFKQHLQRIDTFDRIRVQGTQPTRSQFSSLLQWVSAVKQKPAVTPTTPTIPTTPTLPATSAAGAGAARPARDELAETRYTPSPAAAAPVLYDGTGKSPPSS